jgi:hypothetical protein
MELQGSCPSDDRSGFTRDNELAFEEANAA